MYLKSKDLSSFRSFNANLFIGNRFNFKSILKSYIKNKTKKNFHFSDYILFQEFFSDRLSVQEKNLLFRCRRFFKLRIELKKCKKFSVHHSIHIIWRTWKMHEEMRNEDRDKGMRWKERDRETEEERTMATVIDQ